MMRISRYFCALAIAVSAGFVSVSAQTHYSSNISFGAKAGADMSKVMFSPSVGQIFKPGAVAGLMFRYVEENHFGLIAELEFAQRGWKDDFEGAPYNYSRTVNYLSIPVLAHIYFGRRGRFFLNAGPEIGLVLGESTSMNFDPSQIAQLPDFPFKGNMWSQLSLPVSQKLDYGITAGLGGEFFASERHSLCIEARFYFGLGNLMKSGRTDPFSASNSMSLMATVGYWFRFK